MKTVATIAGFDPTGGAGVLADQETFLAHGLRTVAAVTCHVPQTPDRVHSLHPIPVEIFRAELLSLDSTSELSAIKIGAIGSPSLLEPLAAWLDGRREIPAVVDPVLRASDHTPLLAEEAIEPYLRALSGRTSLFTPNVREARTLAGANESESPEILGGRLLERGMKAVLITSARESSDTVEDLLMARTMKRGEAHWLNSPKWHHSMPHGSGCRLSSAIAAHLAKGASLLDAIHRAKNWFYSSLASSRLTPSGRYIFGSLPLDR